MTSTGVRQVQIALATEVYGMELRLWKEMGERQWGATLRDGSAVVQSDFEEDDLTLAKLHILGEARSRAVSQSGNMSLPSCDTFLDSWKVTRMNRGLRG